MKIAFCFSGYPRKINRSKFFWKNLIDRYNADVYASFWEESDTNLQDDNPKNFIEIYNPKLIEFEKFNLFENSTLNLIKKNIVFPETIKNCVDYKHVIDKMQKYNFISMFYKIWRANLLANSEKYDIVIRCRTDLFPLDINFEINDMLNIPFGTIFNTRYSGCLGKVDYFAYGNPSIMNYYSSIFLHLNTYLTQGYYFHYPEHLLFVHFTKKRIKIRELPQSIYAWDDDKQKFHRALDFNNTNYIEYFSDEHTLNVDPNLTFYNKNNKL